jgi:hypothetical protein
MNPFLVAIDAPYHRERSGDRADRGLRGAFQLESIDAEYPGGSGEGDSVCDVPRTQLEDDPVALRLDRFGALAEVECRLRRCQPVCRGAQDIELARGQPRDGVVVCDATVV